MKERIRQLAEGEVYADTPVLELLTPEIEETIVGGQNYRGDIRIGSSSGVPLRGLIYSNDSRVLLIQNSFAGTTADIAYEVHAEYLEPGSTMEGAFRLVYNGGETAIPFHFHVKKAGSSRSGAVKTLEDFAQLAEERPSEAEKLFASKEFLNLPLMEDMSSRAIYDGLARATVHTGAAEEFLIAAGAKERVRLALEGENSELQFVTEGSDTAGFLTVTRSGWGEVRIRAESDADFISFEKEEWTEADFAENTLKIPFTVCDAKLHGGKNYARLTVRTPLAHYSRTVSARRRADITPPAKRRLRRRKNELELMKTLLKVLAENAQNREDIEYLELCWEEMVGDDEPMPRQKLLRAAISFWKGDRDLTDMILKDAEREISAGRREDPDAYCAFLYLQMRASGSWEQKEQLIRTLRRYSDEGRETLFGFLLMLHLDEGAADRPREVLGRMVEFCRGGYYSPFLYLEAVRVYNRHPDVIRSIGDFEYRVLLFGAKHGLVEENTAVYAAGLAVKSRTPLMPFLRVLTLLYGTYPRDEILGAACAVLIKSERRDEEAFGWYAKGVERDIRLTRLFDYYLASVPADRNEPLPRAIVLYFSYNSPQDPSSREKLYRNLLTFRRDDAEIMKSYREQMHDFAVRSVLAGQTDADLAVICEEMLELEDVDARMAKILPDLLNTCEITVPCENCTDVIAVYGELSEEFQAKITDGRAYIPIFTDSCRLLLAGEDGARYAADVTARRVFSHTDALTRRCREAGSKNAMLRLADCSAILKKKTKTEADLRALRREQTAREIHPQYRRMLTNAIADTVISREDPLEEDVLTCVQYRGLNEARRTALLGILIRLGHYSEAGVLAGHCNFRALPPAEILQLSNEAIQSKLFTKDELLLDMCHWLFEKNELGDLVLEYLCAHYNGASAEMVPILLRATENGVDSGDMAERLLAQMLFAGCSNGMDEVYRIYRRQGGRSTLLTKAYIVVKCNSCFMDDEPAPEGVFRTVMEMLESGREEVPEICVLALMKNFTEEDSLTGREKKMAERLLAGLIRQGRVFPWMKKFEGRIRIPEEIRCREFIEYRSGPGLSPEIVLEEKNGEKTHRLRLQMPEVWRGIYVKPILLFEGDEIHYRVTSGGKTLSEGSLRGGPSPAGDHSRFGAINRLQAEVGGARVQDWQDDVAEYAYRESCAAALFRLPEHD